VSSASVVASTRGHATMVTSLTSTAATVLLASG
jgi:hypothetical protein